MSQSAGITSFKSVVLAACIAVIVLLARHTADMRDTSNGGWWLGVIFVGLLAVGIGSAVWHDQ